MEGVRLRNTSNLVKSGKAVKPVILDSTLAVLLFLIVIGLSLRTPSVVFLHYLMIIEQSERMGQYKKAAMMTAFHNNCLGLSDRSLLDDKLLDLSLLTDLTADVVELSPSDLTLPDNLDLLDSG